MLLARLAKAIGRPGQLQKITDVLIKIYDPQARLRAAGEAVARGNLKVFAEIGLAFARYLEDSGDSSDFDRFCDDLRPGDPPDGQRLLRDAFTTYHAATGAEHIFYANLLVGLHEQTRLQTEIREALDASLADREGLRRQVLKTILPSPWLRVRVMVARLFGRKLPADEFLDRLIDHLQARMREVTTSSLLTLRLAGGHTLRLGTDLRRPFSEGLATLTNPALLELLARIDPTPGDTTGSGARDWGDLPDRMHFITDFFRCYHTWESLHDAPFTAEQVVAIRAGLLPVGPL